MPGESAHIRIVAGHFGSDKPEGFGSVGVKQLGVVQNLVGHWNEILFDPIGIFGHFIAS